MYVEITTVTVAAKPFDKKTNAARIKQLQRLIKDQPKSPYARARKAELTMRLRQQDKATKKEGKSEIKQEVQEPQAKTQKENPADLKQGVSNLKGLSSKYKLDYFGNGDGWDYNPTKAVETAISQPNKLSAEQVVQLCMTNNYGGLASQYVKREGKHADPEIVAALKQARKIAVKAAKSVFEKEHKRILNGVTQEFDKLKKLGPEKVHEMFEGMRKKESEKHGYHFQDDDVDYTSRRLARAQRELNSDNPVGWALNPQDSALHNVLEDLHRYENYGKPSDKTAPPPIHREDEHIYKALRSIVKHNGSVEHYHNSGLSELSYR